MKGYEQGVGRMMWRERKTWKIDCEHAPQSLPVCLQYGKHSVAYSTPNLCMCVMCVCACVCRCGYVCVRCVGVHM